MRERENQVKGAPTNEAIKNSQKAMGGYLYKNGGYDNAGFKALPDYVQAKIKGNSMTYGGGLSQPIKFMSYPQNEMIMVNGGQASGASQGEQAQQIMSAVAQALQQGMAPEEVMGKLVEMGIPEQQAGQLIQGVMAQMSPEGQAPEPEQRKTGGIHIKPENRGKFTAKANSAGMGVQAFANKVLGASEGTYSPARS